MAGPLPLSVCIVSSVTVNRPSLARRPLVGRSNIGLRGLTHFVAKFATAADRWLYL